MELSHIQAAVTTDEEQKTGSLITVYRPQLLVSMALMAFQQLSGNAAVLAFAPEIIATVRTGARHASGLALRHAYGATVVLGCVKALFTAVVVARGDAVGRRVSLLVGSAAAAFSLAVLGSTFAAHVHRHSDDFHNSENTHTAAGAFALLAACVLIAAYSVSFGPVVWLLTAEMFPPALRGRALGVAQVRQTCMRDVH